MTQEKQNASVGVYLGSQLGNNPAFKSAAIQLGRGMAELGLTLVYGGGSVGLMGLISSTAKQYGGKVIGIITEQLIDKEKPPTYLDELYVVDSMYERKRLIHEKSSRFLIMPGGLGTLDELFETWCLVKCGVMKKFMGFVNIDGYFDGLFHFVDSCKQEGFLGDIHQDIPSRYDSAHACVQDLASAYSPALAMA